MNQQLYNLHKRLDKKECKNKENIKNLYKKGLLSSRKYRRGKPYKDQTSLAQIYAHIVASLLASLQVMDNKKVSEDRLGFDEEDKDCFIS